MYACGGGGPPPTTSVTPEPYIGFRRDVLQRLRPEEDVVALVVEGRHLAALEAGVLVE